MTSDTYLYDGSKLKWKQLKNEGSVPSYRSAHDATVADNKFYIFGGAMGAG